MSGMGETACVQDSHARSIANNFRPPGATVARRRLQADSTRILRSSSLHLLRQ